MSSGTDLNVARKNLAAELGDKMKIYLHILKSWFRQKITREDFDHDARGLLTPETVHLHNQFLLAILTKCQTIGASLLSGSDQSSHVAAAALESKQRVKKEKIKRKIAIYNTTIKQRFVSADPLSQAPIIPAQFPEHNDKVPDYATREQLLPDAGMIHGRLIVGAWEFGLDSVDDEAVHILMLAVETELKALIGSMLSRRRGYRLREKRFRHAHSTQSSSLMHRSTAWCDLYNSEAPVAISSAGLPVPSLKPSTDIALRNAAVILAESTDIPVTAEPLTLFDLLETLQVHRSVLPSHTVYTLNIERILDRMSHPSNEELLQDLIHAEEMNMRKKIALEAL